MSTRRRFTALALAIACSAASLAVPGPVLAQADGSSAPTGSGPSGDGQEGNLGLLDIHASPVPDLPAGQGPPLAALKLMALEIEKAARERDNVKAQNHGIIQRDFMLFIDEHFLSRMALDEHLQDLALPGSINEFTGYRATLESTLGLKTTVHGDSASSEVGVTGTVRGHFEGDTFIDPPQQAFDAIAKVIDSLPDLKQEIARREGAGERGEASDILNFGGGQTTGGTGGGGGPQTATGEGSAGQTPGTTATQQQLEGVWAQYTQSVVAGFKRSEARADAALKAIERSLKDDRYESAKAASEKARVERVLGLEKDALKAAISLAQRDYEDLLSSGNVTLAQARAALAPCRHRRDAIFSKANKLFESARDEADAALK